MALFPTNYAHLFTNDVLTLLVSNVETLNNRPDVARCCCAALCRVCVTVAFSSEWICTGVVVSR